MPVNESSSLFAQYVICYCWLLRTRRDIFWSVERLLAFQGLRCMELFVE